MITTEDVQRQVAVAIIVAVEKPSFLLPVQRIIRSVEIKNNLLGRRIEASQEYLYEKLVYLSFVHHDFLVPIGIQQVARLQFQSVQRALPGECATVISTVLPVSSGWIGLAAYRSKKRIRSQRLMIVQIFVSEAQREYPLRNQITNRMFDISFVSHIGQTCGEGIKKAVRQINLPEKKCTGVRADGTTVKVGDYCAITQTLKKQVLLVTLCHLRIGLPVLFNCFVAKEL